ncbi:hypothetical protein LJC15_00125 [Desulfovibrio sp. OttesenSCG-928-G11]|nr:hypothetical protein [Desulfovibrio sp. OttesenSCG-928-G11]
MKALDTTASRIFIAILARLGNKDHVKINNSESFMPVSVDRIFDGPDSLMLSLAHNSVQNGDLMADPDMEFWIAPSGKIYPCAFRNDFMGLNQEAIFFEQGKPCCRPKLQAKLAAFANQWLRNIANQQGIEA